MNADRIQIESEDDGFYIWFRLEEGDLSVRIQDADLDAFYDQVKARIGPYLRERDEARQAVASGMSLAEYTQSEERFSEDTGAYALSDPKHPDWHSVHADLYDSREGK